MVRFKLSRSSIAVVGILVVALALRLAFVFQAAAGGVLHDLVLDVVQYEGFARQVLDGELANPDMGYMNPLYPFFLATVWAISGESRVAVGVIQAVLDSMTVLWIFLLAARLFDRRVALLAAAIYSVYGPAIFYSGLLLATTVVSFLLTLSVLLLLRAMDGGGRLPLLLSGCVFGLAALGRPNLLLVLPAVPIAFLLLWPEGIDRVRRLRWLVVFGIGLILPLGLSGTRNLAASGSPSPFSTNGGINFFMGNGPGASGVFRAPDGVSDSPLEVVTTAVEIASDEAGRELTPRQASRHWFLRGVQHLASHPSDAMSLYLRKTGLFWSKDEVPLNVDYAASRRMVPLMRLPFVEFGLLAPFGIVGLALTVAGRRMRWLLPLLALSYSASVVLFFVAARFRFPIVPWLAIAAAYSVFALMRMVSEGRVRAAVITGLSVVAVLVVVNRASDSANVAREAIHHHNLGKAYMEQGRRDLAEGAYRHALQLFPTHTNSLVNLASLLLEDGKLDEALELSERARQLEPGIAEATLNIGNVFYARGQLEAAVREYRRAAEVDPRYPEACYNLGRVFFDLGRTQEARAQFEHTLELNPEYVEAHYMLGGIVLGQQEYADAVLSFDATIRLQPQHPHAGLYLCLALVNDGQIERARQQCRLAERQGHRIPDQVWQVLGER